MGKLILALLVTLGLGLGTVGCGEKAPEPKKDVIAPPPAAQTTPPAKAD